MFEHFYTTKMSAEGKALQNRFSKIRSKNGRISKVAALVVSFVLVLAIISGTAVLAVVNQRTSANIEIYYKDTLLSFENKPFFRHKTVYLPFFELLETIGLSQKTEVLQEEDTFSIFIEGHHNSYRIKIGNNAITYQYPEQTSERLTPYSPLKKGGILYIPFDYIDWIFNRYNDNYDVSFIYNDINSSVPYQGNAEGMTYPYICDLQYQADNGHFPWRLNPELVVTAALGDGDVFILNQEKTTCRALFLTNETRYIVTLFKPVQTDEFGIWIVQTITRMEES